jgi:hypothetical protein
MNQYQQMLAEDRRLCILRILEEAGGTANDSVLHTALEMWGHTKQPRQNIRADLQFLVNCGLLTDEFLKNIQIVTLTQRGLDVAQGRLSVDGVKKPSIVG